MKHIHLILFVLITFITCSNRNSREGKQNTIDANKQPVAAADSDNYAKQSVDDELAKKIADYLISDYLKNDIKFMDKRDRKFQFYKVDLNGDGKDEIFVRFLTSYFCGTGGCTFLLLSSDMKPITVFTVTRAPIFVEHDTKYNGWALLLVKDNGVFKELKFKDGKYPGNPSMLPKAPYDAPGGHAEIMFDEDFSKAKTYEF